MGDILQDRAPRRRLPRRRRRLAGGDLARRCAACRPSAWASAVRWAQSLAEVPDGAPMLLIANELLDCLPARQFVRTAAGWAEQVVGLDADGELAFGLADRPAAGLLPDAAPGQVFEQSAGPGRAAAPSSAAGSRADGGAALLIDYGRAEPGFGDTLQALRRHEKVDPAGRARRGRPHRPRRLPRRDGRRARRRAPRPPSSPRASSWRRMGIGPRAEALVARRAEPHRRDRPPAHPPDRRRRDGRAVQGLRASIRPTGRRPAFEDDG